MDMNCNGIIVIDMQSGFVSPAKVYSQELAFQIAGIRKILEYRQQNGIYALSVETRDFGEIVPDLDILLEQGETPRFYKQDESAFRSEGVYTNRSRGQWNQRTQLERVLQSEDIFTLVIMGINAPSCVNASIKDAKDLGFNIITSPELVLDTVSTIRKYGRSDTFLREHTRLLDDYRRVIEYLAKKQL